jgi:hypothetical protein
MAEWKTKKTSGLESSTNLYWVAIPLFIYGLSQVIRKQVMSEDGFVYTRYVENFINGKGLVYTSDQFVEGFTSPLWMLLTLLAKKLGDFEYNHIVFVAGYISYLLAFYLLYRASVQANRFNGEGRTNLYLPLIFFVSCYAMTSFFTTALETPLVILYSVWFCNWFLKERPHFVESIFVLGLAPLVRPEHGFFTVFGILGLFLFNRDRLLTIIAGSIGLNIAYMVFRIYYYASFLPVTAYMKNAFNLTNMALGVEYIQNSFNQYHIWLLLILISIASVHRIKLARWNYLNLPVIDRKIHFLLLLAFFQVLYVLLHGGDYRHARLLLQPLVIIFFASSLLERYMVSIVGSLLFLVPFHGEGPLKRGMQAGILLFILSSIFLFQIRNEPPAVTRTPLLSHGYTDEWKREIEGTAAAPNPFASDWNFKLDTHWLKP